jgi:replicative DNA helicase
MIDSVSDCRKRRARFETRATTKSRHAPQNGLRADCPPPHSPEAEQGVGLRAAFNDCLGQCIEKLRSGVRSLRFAHQTIYSAVQMYDHREAIDVITLQQRLKDKQLLEEIGGIPYLNALQDAVPSAANLSYYLEIVLEKFLLRKMIQTCTDVVGRVYDYEGEVDALLDEVERDVLRISRARRAARRRSSSSSIKPSARWKIISIARACWAESRRALPIWTG